MQLLFLVALVRRNLINDVTLKIVGIILHFSWDCSEHHRVIDLKAQVLCLT